MQYSKISKCVTSLVGCLTIAVGLSAQVFSGSIDWHKEAFTFSPFEEQYYDIYTFDDAFFSPLVRTMPYYVVDVPMKQHAALKVRLVAADFEYFDKSEHSENDLVGSELDFRTAVQLDRRTTIGKVSFIPIIRTGNTFKRLVRFTIEVIQEETAPLASFRNEFKSNSVLSSGTIYKIQTQEEGVHRISYEFLTGALGHSGTVASDQIHVFGNGGGRLPESVDAERIDDLEQLSVMMVDGGDGSFDPGDYLLFYADAVHPWSFDESDEVFTMRRNIYEDHNYYFVKIDDIPTEIVEARNSIATTSFTTGGFLDYQRFEEESVNLLDGFVNASGSGKEWFGDHFIVQRSESYNGIFQFANTQTERPAHIAVRFAARMDGTSSTSSFLAKVDGQTFSKSIVGVNTADIESTYARMAVLEDYFFADNDQFDVDIEYPPVSVLSEGWLDYIELNVWRDLAKENGHLRFANPESILHLETTYNLENIGNGIQIWDVTDPQNPVNQLYETRGNNGASFGAPSLELRKFIAFDPNSDVFEPTAMGTVANQNLHGISEADLLIVYHKEFKDQAIRLAEHRRTHNNYVVVTADVDDISNEFSSGKKDPTAIRDMARMLFSRSDNFRFMLLFGDGSFDYKNHLNLSNPQQFIFPYETNNSTQPIRSYPSDDYYALLSPGEGDSNLNGALDIAVGRIPSRTISEARIMVDKIIEYDTDPQTFGDWKLRLTYVADDEDSNLHIAQMDGIASTTTMDHSVYNESKIYVDAFVQENTPGGEFYPDVNQAINNNFFKGHFIISYIGHGGSKSWGHERFLTFTDIASWDNAGKYPLVITATCSFTGYDDPKENTGGERVLFRNRSGAIALLSTVRAVFSRSNARLTRAVFNRLFDKVDGKNPTIGEIMRTAKNANSQDTSGITINSRKFSLFGDPSQVLALPELNVTSLTINGEDAATFNDTLRALEEVTLEGAITDESGNVVSDFNGIVIPSVFDKAVEVVTLGQDQFSSPYEFDERKNPLFKGAASVTNGLFSFTFIIPKDINYVYGAGKLSYYAHDGVSRDAAGYEDKIVIGGIDDNIQPDDQPPVVKVFMNGPSFEFGGEVSPNPDLYVELSDDRGINIAGSSIGHDLVAIMDGNTQNTFRLNAFYESTLDDHTSGTVRFPMSGISPGRHQIVVKAWDVANNSAEGFTEFVVVSNVAPTVSSLENYPNPVVDGTRFRFSHNIASNQLEAHINIFTINGQLVRTISQDVSGEGTFVDLIEWDGNATTDGSVSRGVYVYNVRLIGVDLDGDDIEVESDFEKMILLK